MPLLFAPPLFSRDVYSYFGQGRLLLEGYDPYASGVSVLDRWFADGADPMWGDTPAPYGPFWLMLARGVAEFSGDNALLGAIMFRLLAVLGVAMMAWAVPALARQHGIDPSKAVWIAVANPLVIMHFVAGARTCSGWCGTGGTSGCGETDRLFGTAVYWHFAGGGSLITRAPNRLLDLGDAICRCCLRDLCAHDRHRSGVAVCAVSTRGSKDLAVATDRPRHDLRRRFGTCGNHR